ncbi:MAG: hypothetical protein HY548_08105 [Elusimicrobia bacterium]|nr:hypothetical protein [Elusimicrobiota bacterium]
MTSYQKTTLPAVYIQYEQSLKPFELDLMKALNELNLNLESILNGGIRFQDNVDCKTISFTSSGTPDAENTVTHALGKIPTGFIVANLDKAAIVYSSASAWTASNIYLKVNAASVAVKIIVF